MVAAQKSLLERARERPDLAKAVVRRAFSEGLTSTKQAVSEKLSAEAIVGYSSAGRVIEVGAAVSGFDPGDAVACAGVGHANHAEIVSVPSNLCARVPEGVALDTASLTTVAAIGLHSIRLGGVTVGDRVAVIGCGLVGQIICRLLRCAGAETFAVDIDEAQLADARRSGADHLFLSRPGVERSILGATKNVGLDTVIVAAAASSNAPLLLGAQLARDRGSLVLVGDVPVDLPREPLYRKELNFRVSRSYGPGRYDAEYEERGLDYPIGYVRWTEKRNMECVLDLQARGALDFRDLIEEVYPVESAATAYARLAGEGEDRPRGALLLSYPEERDRTVGIAAAASRTPQVGEPRLDAAPVRVGLIGPGGFARSVIIPTLAAAGASLEVVGGGAGPSADAAFRKFGFARLAASEEAVIEDEGIDAVVICTRHATHAALAVRALETGKHVFCEKPIALSLDELDQVVEAATRSRGILAVGFNRRFSPLVGKLRDFFEGRSTPLTITYRIAAGRVPPNHWQHDLSQGGGRVLGEVGHFVDTVAFLTGADVVRVQAVARTGDDGPVQGRDNVAVTLLLADGSIATIVYAADVGPGVAKERLEVHGSAHSGILDDFREITLHGPTGRTRQRLRAQQKGHAEEIEAFLSRLRRGEYPVPLATIANVTVATVAIVESLRTGAPVALDPNGLRDDRLDSGAERGNARDEPRPNSA
jgi:predicted dehydrogenase/NADPH:quinone reductase-like Zn-dependent oxidoreductase